MSLFTSHVKSRLALHLFILIYLNKYSYLKIHNTNTHTHCESKIAVSLLLYPVLLLKVQYTYANIDNKHANYSFYNALF